MTEHLTADEYREQSRAHRQRAQESFDRCDTDGFLSQWADGLHAQLLERKAQLAEDGWVSEFPRLFDLEGNEQRAKVIEGRWGPCWAFLDERGRFTGRFVSAFPKRESTMRRKGYEERRVPRPADARITGRGYGLSGTAWVETYEVKT